ncbi:MAG: 50S ribosomal protein L1 [Proteobacteria bacterium]|jgi:large subunit ribosomal protein L1|nr:50S ribosomal protein L1 [Pseudomonadota bacterium]
MGKISKKFKLIQESVDFEKEYELEEALGIFDQFKSPKITESLDIAFKLGIAADKSDQNVRGAITLPHSLGKEVAVAVFADGDAASSAKSAGAEHVGMDDLAEQFKKDEVSVDVVIATQAAMKVVGQLGQVLGPKGLMPNPKTGTVTDNVEEAVKNAKSGQVRFRNDKNGIIHGTIGRVGFTKDQLSENLTVLIDELKKLKPAGAKGVYLKSAHISSTFGPGLRINLSSFV